RRTTLAAACPSPPPDGSSWPTSPARSLILPQRDHAGHRRTTPGDGRSRRISAMRCLACGTENRPGVKYCEECGATLDVVCPACGASVPTGKKFCGACGAALAAPVPLASAAATARFESPRAYTPAHLAERILKDRAALSGERKQVTVLFADVSGFTSISERLDPEEVHALINRAFEVMLAEVHRYEGTVNQFLGDGLMALFGAPIAHEDHAQRAAHAALAMQQALSRDRDEPGTIVVAEAARKLIAPYFETRALGAVPVKGKSQPVAAWELLSASGVVTRLAALAVHGLSPFVGRDDARATLERAWTQTRGGRGQAVFVVGDAGLGKSRLLLEFRRRLADLATWIEGDCISFGQSIPFLPIVQMLKQNFGIDDHDARS